MADDASDSPSENNQITATIQELGSSLSIEYSGINSNQLRLTLPACASEVEVVSFKEDEYGPHDFKTAQSTQTARLKYRLDTESNEYARFSNECRLFPLPDHGSDSIAVQTADDVGYVGNRHYLSGEVSIQRENTAGKLPDIEIVLPADDPVVPRVGTDLKFVLHRLFDRYDFRSLPDLFSVFLLPAQTETERCELPHSYHSRGDCIIPVSPGMDGGEIIRRVIRECLRERQTFGEALTEEAEWFFHGYLEFFSGWLECQFLNIGMAEFEQWLENRPKNTAELCQAGSEECVGLSCRAVHPEATVQVAYIDQYIVQATNPSREKLCQNVMNLVYYLDQLAEEGDTISTETIIGGANLCIEGTNTNWLSFEIVEKETQQPPYLIADHSGQALNLEPFADPTTPIETDNSEG